MKAESLLVVALAASVVLLASGPASAVYHPTLGRFVQRDPLGYVDGMGLYEYVASRPPSARDPQGLEVFPMSMVADLQRADPVSRDRRRRAENAVANVAGGSGYVYGKAFDVDEFASKLAAGLAHVSRFGDLH